MSQAPSSQSLGAFGTPAAIDGVLDVGWDGVSPQSFTVGLSGRRDATAKLYLMNDGTNLYFAVTLSQNPASSVDIRLVFPALSQTVRVTGTGTGTFNVTPLGGEARADGSNPRVYEVRQSLASLGLSTGSNYGVRLEIRTGGASSEDAFFPSATETASLQLVGSAAPTVVANANGPYPAIGQVAYSYFDEIPFSSAGSTVDATFLWSFGDGTTSTDANPRKTYNRSGNYTATLTATKNNVSAVSTAEVTITPNVQVQILNPAGREGDRCNGMTVTARHRTITSWDDFHAVLSDGHCRAAFDLEPGWVGVFTVRNTITRRYTIWPLEGLTENEVTVLPKRLGAVCVEAAGGVCNASSSVVLTAASYQVARDVATPLAAPRPNLAIQYRLTGRTIPCEVRGTGRIWVHAQAPLPVGFQRPGFAPSGLGYSIHEASETGGCEVSSIPEGEIVVLESIDGAGNTSTGVVGSTGSDRVTLFPDPDLFGIAKIYDDPNDNPSGKDDIFVTWLGVTKDAAGNPTNTLVVKALASQLQETGTAQFQFAFTEIGGPRNGVAPLLPSSLEVRVICSKQMASCTVSQVSPSNAAQYVTVSGNPTDGASTVELRLNVTGVVSLRLRTRAGVANGFDHSPNLNENAFKWTWPGNGNSFVVAF